MNATVSWRPMRPETPPLSLGSSEETFSLGSLLEWGRIRLEPLGEDEARASAEALLSEITGYPRSVLYMNREEAVSPSGQQAYETGIVKRLERWPLAYITGKAYFWEECLSVTPDCLVPRPETETLIESLIRDSGYGPEDRFRLLDLGSGSGAIGIALLRHFRRAEALFSDISSATLEVTGRNLESHGLMDRARMRQTDLFEGFRGLCFDVIVSNPPYFSSSDWETLAPEIFREPRTALDGGADGLEFYRRIAAGASDLLSPGGLIAVEMGHRQSGDVRQIFEAQGFQKSRTYKDLLGIERVLIVRNRMSKSV